MPDRSPGLAEPGFGPRTMWRHYEYSRLSSTCTVNTVHTGSSSLWGIDGDELRIHVFVSLSPVGSEHIASTVPSLPSMRKRTARRPYLLLVHTDFRASRKREICCSNDHHAKHLKSLMIVWPQRVALVHRVILPAATYQNTPPFHEWRRPDGIGLHRDNDGAYNAKAHAVGRFRPPLWF